MSRILGVDQLLNYYRLRCVTPLYALSIIGLPLIALASPSFPLLPERDGAFVQGQTICTTTSTILQDRAMVHPLSIIYFSLSIVHYSLSIVNYPLLRVFKTCGFKFTKKCIAEENPCIVCFIFIYTIV